MHLTTTALAIGVLTVLTFTLVAALHLERPWLQPWAMLRAAVQLGLLSLVLRGIIHDLRWVAAFLVVMVANASWTVVRRLGLPSRDAVSIPAVLAVATAVPLGLVVLTGAVTPDGRYLLAIGGIVASGSMTVCTLAGRATHDGLVAHRDEVEAWLALGATPRRAARDVLRRAGSVALMPNTDQTRVTGLVALPGAFVGAFFGGASPLDAAQFQLVVLAALLTAGALAVAGWTLRFGAPSRLPRP